MKLISVLFDDGRRATYTTAVLQLLKSDPKVVDIMDLETGEILYIG